MHPMKVKGLAAGLAALYQFDHVAVEVETQGERTAFPVLAVSLLNKESTLELRQELEEEGWTLSWPRRDSVYNTRCERWEISTDLVHWNLKPPRIEAEGEPIETF